jgi:CubicO group peptidase (beta-lactamase class C family)
MTTPAPAAARRVALLALATTVLCGSVAQPKSQPVTPGDSRAGSLLERISEVDLYFTQLADEDLFNGVVLIAVDRDVVLRESYSARGAPEGMATTPDNQFVIASLSKLLVRYAVHSLAEAGRVALASPVSRWIDGLPYGDRVSLGHLVAHTSGLPRELEGVDDLVSLESREFLLRAAREELQFEPGTETLYSNVGYQLLAEVLASLADEGYDELIAQYVTRPLGMTDTAEYVSRPPARLAPGFELSDGQIAAGDVAELSRFRYARFYSTVDDLHRFALGLFDPSITPPTVTERMLADDEVVKHAGAIEGYRAYFSASPTELATFVFLANFEDIPFVRITEDISKILAGQEYEVPSKPNRVAIEVDPAVLARYVGRYRLDVDADQVFEVRSAGAGLQVIDPEGGMTTLFAETESRFFDEPTSNQTLEFTLDQSSGRYEMFLIIEGGLRLETTRVESSVPPH